MANSSSTPSLDFEALLSRDYRPARVTRLIPRDTYRPLAGTSGQRSNKKKFAIDPAGVDDINTSRELMAKKREEESSRLVLSLVTQTRAFIRHLTLVEQEDTRPDVASSLLTPDPPATEGNTNGFAEQDMIGPEFHEVELRDWESKINWEGCFVQPRKDDEGNDVASNLMPPPAPCDAMTLLQRRRNPYLENICFDSTTVSWDGDAADLLAKARAAPLILELGVAGQSVAKHVYQNMVLSAQRPTPDIKSDAYQRRMEREWNGPVTSTAEVSKSLHADKDQMEALIEARQKKRAQMAKDKTNRITEAMGTLALGGGRGRTITSSLMGPGGTERTGRPTRASDSSAAHDREYVEQLDLVNNHALVRDLSKVMLRQYHRPKLPSSVVRQDLSWQFQIRYCGGKASGSGTGAKETAASGASASYNSIMMGSTPGALSKAKLRTDADLSPMEGMLVLLEYTEERPSIQLTKGMAFKIVNYYRGDKARCPVSAGGGDRPARRRLQTETRTSAQSAMAAVSKRLEGPNKETSILDWVGKVPKKSQKEKHEKESIDVLPEGVTEMLHPKVHGPFIGEVEEGMTLTGIISNLFVAPMVRHEPDSTDFLMILKSLSPEKLGHRESLGVVLRDLPSSAFCVGQTLPRTRVYAPNAQGEKAFLNPFISYQIARVLARAQQREGHGLRFDELQDRVLPNLESPGNALRQRLKQVALYDKNTQIWTNKPIGYEDYPGVEALGKTISPEGVAAFETACATRRRLSDLGVHQLLERGSHTVVSVGVTMVYLAGQLNATRELARKTKKLLELSKNNKNIPSVVSAFYEKASGNLENLYKTLRQKYEVAQFIYEELQLAPWHLTGEFIDVHKKGEGTGMMKLTGLGDPSGRGEGFSFLREVDTKPIKSVGNAALTAQVKKITGTEDDLRKLTMKQMAALLRSYGMVQKKIDTLKRWDRVHVIRDLSTKAARYVPLWKFRSFGCTLG